MAAVAPEIEFPQNMEPRCPCVLVLDTSGSMTGEPIQELNEGLQAFESDIKRDEVARVRVDLAIVTFGPVKLQQDFITVEDFTAPRLGLTGTTPMGEAVNYALDLLERRKEQYDEYGVISYRPWLFLVTDGSPDSSSVFSTACERVKREEALGHVLPFAVGVSGADMQTLSWLSNERPPLQLQGMQFKEMFLWLSRSFKKVSAGKPGVQAGLEPAGWGSVPTGR